MTETRSSTGSTSRPSPTPSSAPGPTRGRLWPCPNPGHRQTGRTPPLSVFTDRHGGQRWKCHGCGDGGTAIDLVMRTGHATGVAEALDYLAGPDRAATGQARSPAEARAVAGARAVTGDRAGAAEPTPPAASSTSTAAQGRPVWAWLTEQRAIPPDVIAAAGLGADPGPRHLPRPDGVPKVFPAVVFPVRHDDQVVYTLSRHLRPVVSRWWNTAERVAPNPRVALYRPPATQAASRDMIVTEGPLDALSALAAGYPAAALLGANVSDHQVAERLARTGHRLVLALDNDTAGRNATEQLAAQLDALGAPWTRLPIPDRYNDLNAWHVVCRNHWPATLRASLQLATPPPCAHLRPPSVA